MTDYERFQEQGQVPQSGRGVGLILAFLAIGLGAGAVAGLLFAPGEGKKTRRILKRKYEDALEAFEDFRESAEEVLGRGGEWASSARARGEEWAEAAKSKVAPFRKAIRR
jgi:gas vesicle protein